MSSVYPLKKYLKEEILKDKINFSWLKIYKRTKKSREYNFLFWFRVSYVLHRKKNKIAKKIAQKINHKIRFKFCCDIHRESDIGIGLKIEHLSGIVINSRVKIGNYLHLHQNTTIGMKGNILGESSQGLMAVIGDNVKLGANSCIIGEGLKIGNNVVIGAMSFVNKDIPNDTLYITNKKYSTKNLAPIV